jgi:MFS family permease
MITYLDRSVIASAMPLIAKEFRFSLITVGWILASFRWVFTLFQLRGAWFGDKTARAARSQLWSPGGAYSPPPHGAPRPWWWFGSFLESANPARSPSPPAPLSRCSLSR